MRRYLPYMAIAGIILAMVFNYFDNKTPANVVHAGNLFDTAWNRRLYEPTPVASYDPHIIWINDKTGKRFSIEAKKSSFYGNHVRIVSFRGPDPVEINIQTDDKYWIISSASHGDRIHYNAKEGKEHLAYFKGIVDEANAALTLCTVEVTGQYRPTCPK